ncbi:hypothetical protein GCM10009765_22910 [Fodinicola feengrottensis]|uniref:Uncharacterized protein n=1 Tax=Fodinicola feengrottensis TaxID=435914 RepID=A0ABN2GL01_9ACTN
MSSAYHEHLVVGLRPLLDWHDGLSEQERAEQARRGERYLTLLQNGDVESVDDLPAAAAPDPPPDPDPAVIRTWKPRVCDQN